MKAKLIISGFSEITRKNKQYSKIINVPEFIAYDKKMIVNDKEHVFKIKPEMQLQKYLDDNYQSVVIDWAESKYLHPIHDAKLEFTVTGTKQSEVEQINEMLDKLGITVQDKNDFAAAYIVMKGELKGLSFERKMKLIFMGKKVGHMATSETYKRILDILNGDAKKLNSTPKNTLNAKRK